MIRILKWLPDKWWWCVKASRQRYWFGRTLARVVAAAYFVVNVLAYFIQKMGVLLPDQVRRRLPKPAKHWENYFFNFLRAFSGFPRVKTIFWVIKAFINYALATHELFLLLREEEEIKRRLAELSGPVEGIEIIMRALLDAKKRGRGVIFFTGHYGNPNHGAQMLLGVFKKLATGEEPLIKGMSVEAMIVAPATTEKEVLFFNSLRERLGEGITIKPADKVGLEAMEEWLEAGKHLLMVGDLGYRNTRNFVELDFFGKKARFPRGAFWLAQKTKAPIVVASCFRERIHPFRVNRYVFRAEKIIEVEEGQTKQQGKENIVAAMKKWLKIYEGNIKKFPQQWYPLNKIFCE